MVGDLPRGRLFVTWPVLEGLTASGKTLPHLVQIDAHPDLYPDFEGNPRSHASVTARIRERNLVKSLSQMGVRTFNRPQRVQAEKFSVTIFPACEGLPRREDLPAGPTYLTIDLDGLNPAYAPGVSHHELGGVTTREVITLIWTLPPDRRRYRGIQPPPRPQRHDRSGGHETDQGNDSKDRP